MAGEAMRKSEQSSGRKKKANQARTRESNNSKKSPARRPAVVRDPHDLYERAVQCPEADVKFFDRIFRAQFGRVPSSLKEDFCGTAHLSSTWVKARPDNTAIGVDLHGPTLEYGRKRHVAPLGAAASRLQLRLANVLDIREPKVDLVAALNFSYFVFYTRDELRKYFEVARASLKREGLFVLDIFGGWEAQQLTTETKNVDGYRYYWRQVSFDPITHRTLFYIDFSFPDGSRMDRAFRYDWRFWTIPEVRELLAEAGFKESVVFWETTDRATGGGTGVFRPKTGSESEPGWIAYIVAS